MREAWEMTSPNDPTRPPAEPFLVEPLDVPAYALRSVLAEERVIMLESYSEADARGTYEAFERMEPEVEAPLLYRPRNRAERRRIAAEERREARADARDVRTFDVLTKAAKDEEAELNALLAEHGLEL